MDALIKQFLQAAQQGASTVKNDVSSLFTPSAPTSAMPASQVPNVSPALSQTTNGGIQSTALPAIPQQSNVQNNSQTGNLPGAQDIAQGVSKMGAAVSAPAAVPALTTAEEMGGENPEADVAAAGEVINAADEGNPIAQAAAKAAQQQAVFQPSTEFQDVPPEIKSMPSTAGRGIMTNSKGQIAWQVPGEPFTYTPNAPLKINLGDQGLPEIPQYTTENGATEPMQSGEFNKSNSFQQPIDETPQRSVPGEPQRPSDVTQAEWDSMDSDTQKLITTRLYNPGAKVNPQSWIGKTANTMIKAYSGQAPWAKTLELITGSSIVTTLIEKAMTSFPNFAVGSSALVIAGKGTTTSSVDSTGADSAQGAPSGKAYSVVSPLTTGTIWTEQDFGQQQAQLQDKIDQEKLNDPNQALKDQGTYDSNKITYDSQVNIRPAWTELNTESNLANNVVTDLQSTPISVLNLLNKGYNTLETANNGQYAKLGADLQALSVVTGQDYSRYTSWSSIKGSMDSSINSAQTKFDGVWDTYSGQEGVNPQATNTGASTTSGLPSGAAAPTTAQAPSFNWSANAPQVNSIMQGYKGAQ